MSDTVEAHSGTIEEMVDYVLKHNVQPPKTYSLTVDFKDFSDPNETEQAQIKFYNDIFQYAMKQKFQIDSILELSRDQFETLNFYMKSMGFKFIVHANGSCDDPWTIVESGKQIDCFNITVQLL